ncbi:MAG: replication-relaxation family protein, partial [Candidatus Binatia bacterium]
MNIPTKQSLLARPKYPPALQLTERDVEILQAVWTFRFLSANQVVALLGGSEQAIKNRLRQLFKARYLDRPREQMTMRFRDGYPDIVYAIGDRGSRVLVEQLGLDLATTRWEYRNRSVQERFLRHTLSVSNFLIALILATAKRRDVILLDWQREGQELRNRFRATT